MQTGPHQSFVHKVSVTSQVIEVYLLNRPHTHTTQLFIIILSLCSNYSGPPLVSCWLQPPSFHCVSVPAIPIWQTFFSQSSFTSSKSFKWQTLPQPPAQILPLHISIDIAQYETQSVAIHLLAYYFFLSSDHEAHM